MPFFVIGGILLYLYSKMNAVCSSNQSLCKQQQNICTKGLATSTTCKGKGAIQQQTPMISACVPGEQVVPQGAVVSDDGQNISVRTTNATIAQFLDGLGNIIATIPLSNGQTILFNYSPITPRSANGCSPGSIDISIESIVLQGPGGSTLVPNPFYTTASALQCAPTVWGACKPTLTVSGQAFQDETPSYRQPRAVNRAAGLMTLPSAAAIVSSSPG